MLGKHVKKVMRGLLVWSSLVAGLLAGLAPMAPLWAEEAAGSAVFYPPLPNPVRIQHLLTLSGEKDLATEKSSFAAFVLGDEPSTRQLTQPYGIAIDEGRILVADTAAPGIAIFDLERRSFSLFEGLGSGRLKKPINIRIDRDGKRYVTDTGRNQVLVYDRNHRFLAAYGVIGQFRPVDIAISGDRLYVTDIEHHQIHVLDKQSGKTLFIFGKPGSGPGELFHPTSIAIAPNGDVLVVETSNYRIQRFSSEGEPIKSYGAVGSAPGSFARPKGLAFDRNGRFYVGDAAFENVQLFDPDGKLLMHFGQPGEGIEGLNLPAGIMIDYEQAQRFARYAQPGFSIEYIIIVASQFGPNKIDVFGFGKMAGMKYDDDARAPEGETR